MPALEIRTIQQAYKFALDPTPGQERQLWSHVGGARFAFNWGLTQIAEALDAYGAEKQALAEAGSDAKPATKIPGHFDLCKAWTAHKDNPDTGLHWVGKNFVGTYQAALRDAHVAWKNFFDSRRGARAGRAVGRPRYRSRRRSRPAFQVHGGTLQVSGPRLIKLPKVGEIRTEEPTRKLRRRLEAGTARIVRGTVAQSSRGRWYIALTVEVQREIRTRPTARQAAGGTIGVDLGTRDVITTSDGVVYPAPRFLETALPKLSRLGRAVSRAQDGSKRREQARRKLARLHGRIADCRADYLSKTASSLVHSHAGIVVEGWDAAKIKEDRDGDTTPRRVKQRRNRNLADAAVGQLRWMLTSRAAWYGAQVTVLDKNQPTGRTCSACGAARTKPLAPADQDFRCPACGWSGDRRVNSARALLAMHVAPSGGETLNGRRDGVRPTARKGTGRPPVKRQARTPQGDKAGTPDP